MVIAVESLSRSSQEAATATDQVSGAADELAAQARTLQQAIAFFHVDETEPIALNLGAPRPLSLPTRV